MAEDYQVRIDLSACFFYTSKTMLLVTHALAGATIVTKIKNPLFSFPFAFIFHFLMDYIPHWDLGTSFNKRSKLENFILASLDGMLSLFLVFVFFQRNKPFSSNLWLGVGCSLLPDLLEGPAIFFGWQLFPRLNYFHSNISHQKSQHLLPGLLPQITILVLVLLWL
ncbi:MAG: hypothetical protein JW991_02680 [Candidatus Pacebacteria bacterium]|nr:hypothetical protein [Candidatus Paceibacterota bacterium]